MQEYDVTEPEVIGEIPADLNGIYLRNTENPVHDSLGRYHPFDGDTYRRHNVIDRTFGRLKDWRRIATQYDKLARNFMAAVVIATIVIYWL